MKTLSLILTLLIGSAAWAGGMSGENCNHSSSTAINKDISETDRRVAALVKKVEESQRDRKDGDSGQ